MDEFRTDSTLLHVSKQVDNNITWVVLPFFFTHIKKLKFALLFLPFTFPGLWRAMSCTVLTYRQFNQRMLDSARFQVLLLVSPKLLRCSSGEKGNLISVSKLEEFLLYQKAAARYTQIYCSALLLGHVSVLCPGLTTPEPAPAFWVLHWTPHPQNAWGVESHLVIALK